MSRVKLLLALGLFGLGLSACSLTQPAPKDFVLVDQREAKAEENGNTLQNAELLCKEETKRKGVSSVVAIFSRFRKGSADEDYIACMKRRGYEVKP
ncbi:MAG TPA: hypothetical protein VHK26_12155 [Methyloceanibacter sp.]|jgi:hypothetical protein|nr:hypothetical protein [Methyloceanibacter sp.]